jgi:hypothetical protein
MVGWPFSTGTSSTPWSPRGKAMAELEVPKSMAQKGGDSLDGVMP